MCTKCSGTDCIASGTFKLSENEQIFCDIRFDMEFNQIDAEFGLIIEDKDGIHVNAEWTNAGDIRYCPFCGRLLQLSEYNAIQLTCVNNKNYEQCLTLGKTYLVKEVDGMQEVVDDNGEWLQTILKRFE